MQKIRVLSVVLPCQNEQEAAAEMMTRLLRVRETFEQGGVRMQIIVVDDGSTDRSREILRGFRFVEIVEHGYARGYGAALRTGFSRATGDRIVFLDMDRTYMPEDIPKLWAEAERKDLDLLFGSRPFVKSDMPALRSLGNFLFTFALRMLFRGGISDVCTGMRVLHARRRDEVLQLHSNGLNFSIQLTAHAAGQGWKIGEMPIAYEERLGDSKLSVTKDGFQFLWTLLKMRWSPAK